MRRGLVVAMVLAPLLASAQEPERLLLYKVERIAPTQAPTIDGRLDEPVWADRQALSSMRNFLGPLTGELATQASEFVIISDGAKLYLGITFLDEEMDAVRFDPSKAPYWNDCTELYFDPAHDGTRSIQLSIDCGGQRYWARQVNDGAGWINDTAWFMMADWHCAVVRGKDRWTMEVAITARSFGIDATPGSVCGFNPCRFRLGAEQQEFSAWGFEGSRRQKNMDAWGHLVFLGEGAQAGGPVTAADVALVYPDLTGREVRVPAAGGFTTFTADGQTTVGFRELLRTRSGALQARFDAATGAVAALPGDDRRAAKLRETLEPAQQNAAELLAQARAGRLTLGTFDRLGDAMTKADAELREITGRARIVELALAVKEGR